MGPEARIQKNVIAYARSLGVEVIRCVFRPGASSGWPDVIFLIPGGRPLFIEFKAPGGKTTPLQDSRIRWLAEKGYDVLVAYGADEARSAISQAMACPRLSAPSG